MCDRYCLSVEDMYDINYSLILVSTNGYWKFSIAETFFGDGVSSRIIIYPIIILNLLLFSLIRSKVKQTFRLGIDQN